MLCYAMLCYAILYYTILYAIIHFNYSHKSNASVDKEGTFGEVVIQLVHSDTIDLFESVEKTKRNQKASTVYIYY